MVSSYVLLVMDSSLSPPMGRRMSANCASLLLSLLKIPTTVVTALAFSTSSMTSAELPLWDTAMTSVLPSSCPNWKRDSSKEL